MQHAAIFPRVLTALALSFVFALLPAAAFAAPAAGDLVKLQDDGDLSTTSDSAVYYVGADGKRYGFPNSRTYFTWYEDFSLVKIVMPEELAALPLGGNVTYRPGTKLIKIISDPNVYAVEPGGKLRWITAESIAVALYGASWNKIIDDVPDAFFTNYEIGEPLNALTYPTGSVVKRASDGAHFYIDGGAKRRIPDDASLVALRVQDQFVRSTTSDLATYLDADEVTDVSGLTDASQGNLTSAAIVPTFTAKTPPSSFIPVGSSATLLDLRLSSQKAVRISRLAFKITATTNEVDDDTDEDDDERFDDENVSGIDDDVGGLVLGNNGQTNLSKLRVLSDTGLSLFGTKELVKDVFQDQEQMVYFDGNVSVAAGGEVILRLTADVSSVLPNDEGYEIALVPAETRVVDVATGDAVAFLPTINLVSPNLVTLSSSMEISASANPGSNTYILGTKEAGVGGFDFKATASAVNVIKQLTLQAYVDEEGVAGFLPGGDTDNGTERLARDIVPQVSLYDGAGVKLAGPVTVSVAGKVTFSGFSHSVAAGSTATLVIKGDIPTTLDLESNPDRISFDIVNTETDVTVVDGSGAAVKTEGVNLNGEEEPVFVATVKGGGEIDFTWSPGGGNAVAGEEVQLGTLAFETEDDSYDLRTVSFVQEGTAATSLGDIRLEYESDDTTVSVDGDFIGNVATFVNLPVILEHDKKTEIKLFGDVIQRDGGAVYGETIAVSFGSGASLEFVSRSSLESYSASDVASSGDFTLKSNSPSSWLVRFSKLNVTTSPDTPVGPVFKTANAEVLRFTMQADEAGAVRVKRMAFKLKPSDAGRDGSDNDALENWADLNGDFADDDAIISLKRVIANETDPTIGESTSARIRYSVFREGTLNSTPSLADSAAGEYGVVAIEFPEGSEYFLAAGAEITFYLEVYLSAFSDVQDYTLDVELLGASDFEWTDIPSGAYTSLSGTDASWLPIKETLVVKK